MTVSLPVTYIVHILIKEGHEQVFADLSGELVRDTRVEPGCLHYSFLRARANPRSFTMIESFRDYQALVAHGTRLKEKYGAPSGTESPLPGYITQHFETVSFAQVDEIAPAEAPMRATWMSAHDRD